MECMLCGSLLVCFVFAWARFFPPDWESLDPYTQILMDEVWHGMGKTKRDGK